MFSSSELRKVHIEISNRCQASCPMCPRTIHGGLDNPSLEINEWTLNDFQRIFTPEILSRLERISFCGNFGDPVMNNDLIDMCSYATTSNPKIRLEVHTNGSMRTRSWWQALYQALPEDHIVVFALDGLEDTNHIYRVGTNFRKIMESAEAFISEGGKARWVFIRFGHNIHQEQEAEELSREMGFKEFNVKDSKRFGTSYPVVNKDGETIYHLEQPTKKINIVDRHDLENHKDWDRATEIDCFAENDREFYIDAHYRLSPCCMTAAFLYTNYDAELLKKYDLYTDDNVVHIGKEIQQQMYDIIDSVGGIDSINVRDRGLDTVIDDPRWNSVWRELWNNRGSSTCIIMCSPDSPYIKLEEQVSVRKEVGEDV